MPDDEKTPTPMALMNTDEAAALLESWEWVVHWMDDKQGFTASNVKRTGNESNFHFNQSCYRHNENTRQPGRAVSNCLWRDARLLLMEELPRSPDPEGFPPPHDEISQGLRRLLLIQPDLMERPALREGLALILSRVLRDAYPAAADVLAQYAGNAEAPRVKERKDK